MWRRSGERPINGSFTPRATKQEFARTAANEWFVCCHTIGVFTEKEMGLK
jgi:hypothetical protein